MTEVEVRITVRCRDEAMARKVQAECLPDLDELLAMDGVTAVYAEWTVDGRRRR